jgi:hypothetical protein
MAGYCEHGNESVRFELITTLNIKTAVLWDVTSCNLMNGLRRFRRHILLPSSGFVKCPKDGNSWPMFFQNGFKHLLDSRRHITEDCIFNCNESSVSLKGG